jgi:hypothetical protein
VVDGQHTDDLEHECESNLVKVVCDRFKGTKPGVCSSSAVRGVSVLFFSFSPPTLSIVLSLECRFPLRIMTGITSNSSTERVREGERETR